MRHIRYGEGCGRGKTANAASCLRVQDMMRRRTRMQDRLALLKVNINSLTEEGGVNLVPSTHAKAGFAEGQSVQGVMWAKDFIVWCFNRFRNGGDTVCSPSFCWSFGVKICKPRAKLASLLVSFAEVQPILGDKVMY